MKRAFDIAVSLLGLLVTSPILAIAALTICFESVGSPIFVQKRIGYGGRLFSCFKLRTMYSGTPSTPTHLTQVAAVTPVGMWLRRWKIDELPQLLNVLAGDMSLVGPRPCLPTQTELLEARSRLGIMEVHPGITGLAQVRNIDMSEPDRLAGVDAEYVRTLTFMNDLRLIIATMFGGGIGIDRLPKKLSY